MYMQKILSKPVLMCERQVKKKSALGKRSRYYQSQMDMEMLLSGSEYEELPNTYVIFICDFDPFGEEKYR